MLFVDTCWVFQCWHWFRQSETQQSETYHAISIAVNLWPLTTLHNKSSHFQFYIQYLNQRLYSSSIILNITFVIPEKEYLFHDPAYFFFVFIYLLLFSFSFLFCYFLFYFSTPITNQLFIFYLIIYLLSPY